MVQLYNKYHQDGFQILAFPCNQFANQEPGSNEQIKTFAQGKYDSQFPLFSKIEVNGEDTHEVYKFLRRNSPLHDAKTDTTKYLPWSFTKFLIDSNGQVAGYYLPNQSPKKCVSQIEEMLYQ